MMRKIVSIFLVMVFALGLMSCSKKEVVEIDETEKSGHSEIEPGKYRDMFGEQCIKEIRHESEWQKEAWIEYDTEGNVRKYHGYDRDKGAIGNEYEEEYDAEGNLLRHTEYYSGADSIEYEVVYDSQQNLLKYFSYNYDGMIDEGKEYEYNDSGNMVKQISYGYYGKISSCQEFDGNGNEIKEIFYDDGEIESWTEYEYAPDGSLLKETSYGRDGEMDEAYIYENKTDANGNVIESSVNYANGEKDHWTEYEYDSHGNKTKETAYNWDLESPVDQYSYEYEYDNSGNMRTATTYGSWGLMAQRLEYDESGAVVKEVCPDNNGWEEVCYDKDGVTDVSHYNDDWELKYKETFVYNEDGQLKEYVIYDAYVNEYSLNLELDGNGNVIREVSRESGQTEEKEYYEADERIRLAGNRKIEFSYKDRNYVAYRGKARSQILSTADGIMTGMQEYDRNGLCIKDIAYDSKGKITRWTEQERDSDGCEIKYSSFHPDGTKDFENETKYRNEYERDADGYVTSRKKYDEEDNLILWVEYIPMTYEKVE